MTIHRNARTDLRNALVSYMTGEIRTFAFDDLNSLFSENEDLSVQQVSRFLYGIHDDIINHPISVSAQRWEVLRRIVTFLGTNLEIETTEIQPAWPFHDEAEWAAYEHVADKITLPDYDPLIHGRQYQPWWNRIPSGIGFLVLGGLMVVLFLVLSLL